MQYLDYSYSLVPGGAEITGYHGTAQEVIFPAQLDGQPLVRIGRCAFTMNMTLTRVEIPEGVTEIGFGAFERCLNLRAVHLPQSLTKMGFRAFARCDQLEEINLPDGIAVMEEGVFNGCPNLCISRLPAGLQVIGKNAFLGCNAIETLHIPQGVSRIEAQAFSGCGVRTLSIPESVTEIGADAFQGCSCLEGIRLPAAFAAYERDLRVGYGLMVLGGLTVVGSFTYTMLRGMAILEDYDGPGQELVIPESIEGHTVAGISHMIFLNLPMLERISLPRALAHVVDVVPHGVQIIFRD